MSYTRETVLLPLKLRLPSTKKIGDMYVPNIVMSKTKLPTNYYAQINTTFMQKFIEFISGDIIIEGGKLYIPKTVLYEICQDKTILSDEFKNNFLLTPRDHQIINVIEMPEIEEEIFLSVFGRKIDIKNCRIFDVLDVCNKYNIGSLIKYITDNLDVLEFCIACEYDRLNCYRHLNREFFAELYEYAIKINYDCVIRPNKYCNPITYDVARTVHKYGSSYDDKKFAVSENKQMMVPHDHKTIPAKNIFRNQKLPNVELLDDLKKSTKYESINRLYEMYTEYLGDIHETPSEDNTFNTELRKFLLKIRPLLIYQSHMDNIIDID